MVTPEEAGRVAEDANRYAFDHIDVEISHDVNWPEMPEVRLTFIGEQDWEMFKARIRARED